MQKESISQNVLSRSLELPCGILLKNRIAKSAMSDSLANGKGDPSDTQIRLYQRWAEGGLALSIIGEVQIDVGYPEKPGNLVVTEASNQQMLQALAQKGTANHAHLWPQLGHAGALSHPPISKPKGPSALNIEGFTCGGMTEDEVKALPDLFAVAASRVKAVGFTGVQIHAAHGFLLSQFLSPLFNRRDDHYGGSIQARASIILEIIEKVRHAVGDKFPIAIKINSSDQLEGGLSECDALEFIRMLDQTSIDLIDISGGTYFPGAKASSDSTGSGPYFIDFAQRAKAVTSIPLMVTGGFKTQAQAIEAVTSGAVDVVGIARAMVLDPNLPKAWLSTKDETELKNPKNPVFPKFTLPPIGGITAWYTMRLTALGEDQENTFTLDLPEAVRMYDERDEKRCIDWAKNFTVE